MAWRHISHGVSPKGVFDFLKAYKQFKHNFFLLKYKARSKN